MNDNNTAKKVDAAPVQIALGEEEQNLLKKMRERAAKAISKMPPIMVMV